ncbi:MAG: hypothetical protein PUB20_08010 [Clostridia bacterium]|nr:hypothetical protein [Clostridia bacterium]
MLRSNSQLIGIINGFITAAVIIISISLVASGIAISKVNSEYMETGVRAAKIIAERENEQISVSLNDAMMYEGSSKSEILEKVLELMPPPVNTGYYIYRELYSLAGAE